MRGLFPVALGLMSCLIAAPLMLAQASPAKGDEPATGQSKPAGEGQKPVPASSANPFPEDTSTVPVMPSKPTPDLPERTYGTERAPLPLPGDELDPVRSPDDAEPAPSSSQTDDSSSSLAGMDKLLPRPGDDQPDKKKGKLSVKEPNHQEAASKDIDVGVYYLQTKNWKGALSRFESAMVLDPENPDVYWGLAEADRHLGNFADARANYEKVAEYDPDSHHGKEAMKALKEPEIANGKNTAAVAPATEIK
ncbi:MAG: tetratricopeptide repeat protein [Terracidiphilus sp.]|jgi:hypothetical protein